MKRLTKLMLAVFLAISMPISSWAGEVIDIVEEYDVELIDSVEITSEEVVIENDVEVIEVIEEVTEEVTEEVIEEVTEEVTEAVIEDVIIEDLISEEENQPLLEERSGNWDFISYALDDDGVLTISGSRALETQLSTLEWISEVRSVVIMDGITSIKNDVFKGCSGIDSVTIPDSVTSIGKSTFENCSGIKYLKLPLSLDVSTAFKGCSAIEKIVYTKGTGTVYNYTIDSTSPYYYQYLPGYISKEKLSEVVFENGVTAIPALMLRDCAAVASVSLPSTLTSIGQSAFQGCESLETVTLPDNVTVIPNSLFFWLHIAYQHKY